MQHDLAKWSSLLLIWQTHVVGLDLHLQPWLCHQAKHAAVCKIFNNNSSSRQGHWEAPNTRPRLLLFSPRPLIKRTCDKFLVSPSLSQPHPAQRFLSVIRTSKGAGVALSLQSLLLEGNSWLPLPARRSLLGSSWIIWSSQAQKGRRFLKWRWYVQSVACMFMQLGWRTLLF